MKILPVLNNVMYSRDGIDFPCFITLQLKKDYITNVLLNENDVDDLFDEQKDIGTLFITATEISITFNLKNLPSLYNGWDMLRLSNVNYLVVKRDDDYLFYFVKTASVVNAFQVKFTADLDVITSYVDDGAFLTDGETFTKRAFVDRFNVGNTYWDFALTSKLHNPEQINTKFNGRIIKNSYPMRYKFSSETEDVLDLLNETSWLVVYVAQDSEDLSNGIILRGKDNGNDVLEIPYHMYFAPTTLAKITDGAGGLWDFSALQLYSYYKDNPNTLAITIMDVFPFIDTNDHMNVTIISDLLRFFTNNLDSNDTIEFRAHPLYLTTRGWFEKVIYEEEFTETEDIILTEIQPVGLPLAHTQLKNYRNEPKLYVKPNSTYILKQMSDDGYEFSPNLLVVNTIHIKQAQAYIPEIQKERFDIKFGVYDDPTNANTSLNIANNLILPTQLDAWKLYVASHQVSIVSGMVAKIGVGAITTAIGFAVNPITGVVAGASATASVIAEYVRREDIKKTPDKTVVGNSLQDSFVLTAVKPLLIYEELLESDMKQISIFLHKFAYSINDDIDIKDNYKSRYYFNFLQVDNIEQVFIKDISYQAMSLLSDIFVSGVRLWHYRDKDTFKGVGNYKYDNTEV